MPLANKLLAALSHEFRCHRWLAVPLAICWAIEVTPDGWRWWWMRIAAARSLRSVYRRFNQAMHANLPVGTSNKSPAPTPSP
jgi:hypothetical protein